MDPANKRNRKARPCTIYPICENSVQFGTLDQLKDVQVTDEIAAGSIDQSGTNIEQAVDDALRSFPPYHLKRLILLTDGNENSGE